MSGTIKNVILVGASGETGSPILSALLASSFPFVISVLTRASSNRTFPAAVRAVSSDYSLSSLTSAFQSQDAVIVAVGYEAYAANHEALIGAAVAAGVKRFVASEYGSNTLNERSRALFGGEEFVKWKALKALKEQESSGLTWTGIATGPFFDWGFKFGLSGFTLATRSATIFDGGNKPFSTSNISQVANSVVGVLQHPEETSNKYIYVHSFTVTQNEILAALEKATGTKWDVQHATVEATLVKGKEMLAKGDKAGAILLLQACFMGEGYGSDFERDERLANEMLGLPVQGLEESVRRVVEG